MAEGTCVSKPPTDQQLQHLVQVHAYKVMLTDNINDVCRYVLCTDDMLCGLLRLLGAIYNNIPFERSLDKSFKKFGAGFFVKNHGKMRTEVVVELITGNFLHQILWGLICPTGGLHSKSNVKFINTHLLIIHC